jgi:hypothetical protein
LRPVTLVPRQFQAAENLGSRQQQRLPLLALLALLWRRLPLGLRVSLSLSSADLIFD